MNQGFENIADVARHSRLIGIAIGAGSVLQAAWRDSRVSRALQPAVSQFSQQSDAERIRWIAVALMVAALAHLALRSMLSPTIAPAVPAFFIGGIAAVSALVAWQAPAFDRALADSRVRRAVHRIFR